MRLFWLLHPLLWHLCWSTTTTTSCLNHPPWHRDESSNKWAKTADDLWMVGANFIPSTAVNELEMFQRDTYDPETIDRELGYAESLGFNAIRVFLHNLLWEDSDSFIETVDSFLCIASKHNIGVMLVLLDSCWNAYPALGPQPEPIPYVHNSQWVQAPGYESIHNSSKFAELKPYITGVIGHFQNDSRIIAWDVWNEPDNSGYTDELIAPLMSQVFDWCRSASPSQPLTTPVWKGRHFYYPSTLSSLERIQIEQSDIISFHHYGSLELLASTIKGLQSYGKPVVCTEYMAREAGSFFNPHLGYMKDTGVCAFNWGLVSGRTQTIYPWDSANDPNPYYGIEPDPWFHDILRSDGTPKYEDETEYIRNLTSANKRPCLSS